MTYFMYGHQIERRRGTKGGRKAQDASKNGRNQFYVLERRCGITIHKAQCIELKRSYMRYIPVSQSWLVIFPLYLIPFHFWV